MGCHFEEMKAGTKGSVCYSLFPGCWSPAFEDAVVLELLPEDRVKVKTESGKIIETHKGNFNAYTEQENVPVQLKLFE